MARYELHVRPSVAKDLRGIPRADVKRILARIEALVVNYADKRVKHTEVVTLEERFGHLVERYAVTIKRRDFLNQFLALMLRVEDMIFADLEIQPADIAGLARAMPGHGGILSAPGSERQGYRGRTDSSVLHRVSASSHDNPWKLHG